MAHSSAGRTRTLLLLSASTHSLGLRPWLCPLAIAGRRFPFLLQEVAQDHPVVFAVALQTLGQVAWERAGTPVWALVEETLAEAVKHQIPPAFSPSTAVAKQVREVRASLNRYCLQTWSTP